MHLQDFMALKKTNSLIKKPMNGISVKKYDTQWFWEKKKKKEATNKKMNTYALND